MRSDGKFNHYVCHMLGDYVNFRARTANINVSQDQMNDICSDIWQHIDGLSGSSICFIIMILLRTASKNYSLAPVLHPLFYKTHEVLLRQQESHRLFPKWLTIILTVLFYKHWFEMCTTLKDKKSHHDWAINAIKANDFDRFGNHMKLDKYKTIFRSDDRFLHALIRSWNIV